VNTVRWKGETGNEIQKIRNLAPVLTAKMLTEAEEQRRILPGDVGRCRNGAPRAGVSRWRGSTVCASVFQLM